MFQKKTTFILGAGASYETGFPLGKKLRDDICDVLLSYSMEKRDFGHTEITSFAHQQFSHRAENVCKALGHSLRHFNSIDDCLYTHQASDEKLVIGKFAIASLIASYERKSQVRNMWSDKYSGHLPTILKASWLGSFVTKLIDGVPLSSVERVFDNVNIINFNYDRSLYAVLWRALQSAFDINSDRAFEIVKSLNSIHPYGSLGNLDKSSSGINSWGLPQGHLEEASKAIKVYTEQATTPEAEIMAARQTLAQSAVIVFLGFGFHPQNMQLLDYNLCVNLPGSVGEKSVYATMKDLSHAQCDRATQLIKQSFNGAIGLPRYMNDLTCKEYLEQNLAIM